MGISTVKMDNAAERADEGTRAPCCSQMESQKCGVFLDSKQLRTTTSTSPSPTTIRAVMTIELLSLYQYGWVHDF